MSENRKTNRKIVGKCLACDTTGRLQRGLCESHYQQFRRQREKLSADQQDVFEQHLIDKGLLLPSRQGQRNVDNIFADELEEFLGTDPHPPTLTAEELLAVRDKIQANIPKEPTVRSKKAKK